ncbi:hypothetical protein K3495_g3253 [Podosphaera aphanis]|nr:hypothetical protein K3495_g3253 [Podosphaera aphanis]
MPNRPDSTRETTRGSVDASQYTLTRTRNLPISARQLESEDAYDAPRELELSIPAEDARGAHRELESLREQAFSDEVTTLSGSSELYSKTVELPEASNQREQVMHGNTVTHSNLLKPLNSKTRSERMTKSTRERKAFGASVIKSANAQEAVFNNPDESTSLGVPTLIYESVTLEQAMEEDKDVWIEAITQGAQSSSNNGHINCA